MAEIPSGKHTFLNAWPLLQSVVSCIPWASAIAIEGNFCYIKKPNKLDCMLKSWIGLVAVASGWVQCTSHQSVLGQREKCQGLYVFFKFRHVLCLLFCLVQKGQTLVKTCLEETPGTAFWFAIMLAVRNSYHITIHSVSILHTLHTLPAHWCTGEMCAYKRIKPDCAPTCVSISRV